LIFLLIWEKKKEKMVSEQILPADQLIVGHVNDAVRMFNQCVESTKKSQDEVTALIDKIIADLNFIRQQTAKDDFDIEVPLRSLRDCKKRLSVVCSILNNLRERLKNLLSSCNPVQ
ncbi:hypothetical protein T08_15418, partial [Trichinella sp. T8]